MSLSKDPEKISSMFDDISGKYDKLNHILSFGADRAWRRGLVRELSRRIEAIGRTVSNTKVLDLACGTGDLSALLSKSGFNVVGGDFFPADAPSGKVQESRYRISVGRCGESTL